MPVLRPLALGLSKGSTDAEAVAEAWRRSGADGLRLIDGEYAAVIVTDGSIRVTLIRDHIGTHPLLWHFDGCFVRYATSMAALLATLPDRPRVDEVTVARFLRT
jgi:asparagine synthetase B (glutamine-hydrolysing)